MIQIALLIAGIITLIRIPKLRRRTAADYPGVDPERFRQWHEANLKAAYAFVIATWGALAIQVLLLPVILYDGWKVVNNLIFMIVLLTGMSYFFFSIDHRRGSIRIAAGLGRWFLMFAFGAMFGATVGARMSLLVGRINFLVFDWFLGLFGRGPHV
ncbi:MAG: hypothetical protein Q7T82_10265 [Armatimonadota bacterium]|nr:hypothetical protein [Armatimonadota bacterium]